MLWSATAAKRVEHINTRCASEPDKPHRFSTDDLVAALGCDQEDAAEVINQLDGGHNAVTVLGKAAPGFED